MASVPNPTTFGYQNFFSALLTADVTNIAQDIFLDTIPDGTSGILVIDPYNPATREVIYYTSKTVAKVTCPSDGRGFDGSSAKSHVAGTYAIMAPVATFFEWLSDGSTSNDPARLYSQPHYDFLNKFVVSGGVVTATTGLGIAYTDTVAYYNGRRYTLAGSSATLSANSTTYVGVITDDTFTSASFFTSTGSTAAATPRIILAKIVTGASTVTSITQTGLVDFGSGIFAPIYPVLRGMDYPAWRPYTPTLTNITLGNGTAFARYKRMGDTVDVYFRFIMGSTSAMGTQPKISLPFAAQGDTYTTSTVLNPLGLAEILDLGTVTYTGPVGTTDNTNATIFASGSAGTYLSVENVTSTVPMTWTTGDAIALSLRYECVN